MRRFSVYLCVTLATFFWGSAFHASKVSVEAMPPFTAATLRFGLAAMILMGMCVVAEPRWWEQTRRHVGMLVVLGLLGVTGFAGFLFWGLAHTSAINGSMIMGTNPLMVMVFARLIDGHPISRRQQVGGLLGVIGVVAVVVGGSWNNLAHLQVSRGDGLILIANVCWALYTLLNRRLVGISPLVLTAVSTAAGALGLGVVAWGEHALVTAWGVSGSVWAAVAYLAVFGSVLAFLFWNWGVSALGAHRTSIFFNLVPFFAVLTSIGLGGNVAASQLLGGGLVVLGVLVATGVIRV